MLKKQKQQWKRLTTFSTCALSFGWSYTPQIFALNSGVFPCEGYIFAMENSLNTDYVACKLSHLENGNKKWQISVSVPKMTGGPGSYYYSSSVMDAVENQSTSSLIFTSYIQCMFSPFACMGLV